MINNEQPVPGRDVISTGFSDLDDIVDGMRPGHLAVVASRPGIGRTTALASIVEGVAVRNRISTLVFTLEESSAEFHQRIFCIHGRVPMRPDDVPEKGDGEWQAQLDERTKVRIADATKAMASAPLRTCAAPSLTMAELAKDARVAVSEHGVKFIAVDGLNDIKPERQNDLREREVGDVARDLKSLARELNIPILATAHLNRVPESRPHRVPRLDDLRESGAVTFAASWIVLLHRPDCCAECSRPCECDFIVAKNRYGTEGHSLAMGAQYHYSRFVQMAKT